MKKVKKLLNSEQEIHLFTCGCGSLTHQLVLSFWSDDIKNEDSPDCFLSFIIEPKNLWSRIKDAFYCIFYKERIYVEELLLDKEDIEELRKGLNTYLKKIKEYKKANVSRKL